LQNDVFCCCKSCNYPDQPDIYTEVVIFIHSYLLYKKSIKLIKYDLVCVKLLRVSMGLANKDNCFLECFCFVWFYSTSTQLRSYGTETEISSGAMSKNKTTSPNSSNHLVASYDHWSRSIKGVPKPRFISHSHTDYIWCPGRSPQSKDLFDWMSLIDFTV
jgi:hypothetical protein